MHKITIEFEVVITPDEDGTYTAEIPRLTGCNSEGDTIEEALANIQEAAIGYIRSFVESLSEAEHDAWWERQFAKTTDEQWDRLIKKRKRTKGER